MKDDKMGLSLCLSVFTFCCAISHLLKYTLLSLSLPPPCVSLPLLQKETNLNMELCDSDPIFQIGDWSESEGIDLIVNK